MEPLVEPTIGRWFTAPFREQRKDVVHRVRAMIRGLVLTGPPFANGQLLC
jgi:hypothetical protein